MEVDNKKTKEEQLLDLQLKNQKRMDEAWRLRSTLLKILIPILAIPFLLFYCYIFFIIVVILK